jgi:ferredoxin
MKLNVDTSKCSGIGLCEMAAPTVYTVGDDGQSHVLKDEPSADELPAVDEAIVGCPTGALSMQG